MRLSRSEQRRRFASSGVATIARDKAEHARYHSEGGVYHSSRMETQGVLLPYVVPSVDFRWCSHSDGCECEAELGEYYCAFHAEVSALCDPDIVARISTAQLGVVSGPDGLKADGWGIVRGLGRSIYEIQEMASAKRREIEASRLARLRQREAARERRRIYVAFRDTQRAQREHEAAMRREKWAAQLVEWEGERRRKVQEVLARQRLRELVRQDRAAERSAWENPGPEFFAWLNKAYLDFKVRSSADYRCRVLRQCARKRHQRLEARAGFASPRCTGSLIT